MAVLGCVIHGCFVPKCNERNGHMNLWEQLFAMLEEAFGELGIEHKMIDGVEAPQIGNTLLAFLPVADEADQRVLLEIALAELGEGMLFLQFYSTVVFECVQSPDVLLEAINTVNFYCPVGSFGIFSEQGNMYHKYCLLIDTEDSVESIFENALMAFHAIHSILSLRAPLLAKLALGDIDVETAEQQGLFN